MSSSERLTSAAPRFSFTRSRRRVPKIGTMLGLFARSQASATCAAVAPLAAASCSTAATTAWLALHPASKALEHDLAAPLPALQTAVRLLKRPRADLAQCLRQRRPDLAGVDQSRDLTQNLTLGSNVCGFHYRPGEHRLQMDRD